MAYFEKRGNAWRAQIRKKGHPTLSATFDTKAELRRLRAELKRVTEERDILKKAAAYFAKESG